MSELRYNLITKIWVIFATERAKRPRDFSKAKQERVTLPEFKRDCPFCPGNENMTPRETYRLPDGQAWKVRVTPNKFSALSPQKELTRKKQGTFRGINGHGIHEVIIEHPRHNAAIPLMAEEEIENILKTYKSRYLCIQQIDHIEAIVIFKNHGLQAGTSLEHPHSQLIATPIVPPLIRNLFIQAINYFDETGQCIFCQTLEEELQAKERIVLETEKFVSFMPYAALVPFHLWIFPRRHSPSFSDITDDEIRDLAGNLKGTLGRLYHGLDNPDMNLTIHSIPINERGVGHFHWHISVLPRVSKFAGFELGSGISINAALPEASAEFLRHVEI